MSEARASAGMYRGALPLFGAVTLAITLAGQIRAEPFARSENYSQSVYGNWSLLCSMEIAQRAPCEVSQVVQVQNHRGTSLLRFDLSCIRPALICTIELLLPADTDTSEAVLINLGEVGPPFALALGDCSSRRCVASSAIPYALALEVEAANALSASFLNRRQEHRTVELSLIGFAPAFGRMVDLNMGPAR